MSDLVQVDVLEPGIVSATLNRPERRNALSIDLLEQLTWQPVAFDRRGLPHQRIGRPGIDIDAQEQLGVRHCRLRGELHSLAADHDSAVRAAVAALGQPIGEPDQQSPRQRLLAIDRHIRWPPEFRHEFASQLVRCPLDELRRPDVDRPEDEIALPARVELL